MIIPSLLRTKLNRPAVTQDYVSRQRLLAQLNQHRDRLLVLVSAPAGFGKSTLLSAWLEACDWPSAWLSLDEHDNDLVTFLSYFLAAIQTVFPEIGQETEALLNAPTLSPVRVLANCLINELDGLDQPFILVLDDYHVIHESAIHDLFSQLLRHPPRHLHLVLASRHDPAFPLASFRARGQMAELRSPELRFSRAEAAAFLRNILGFDVEDETAAVLDVLDEKIEGWAAGLRMAALSLRDKTDRTHKTDGVWRGQAAQADSAAPATDAADHNHYAMDYLVSEVLSRQPPTMQEFLLKTSILERLSGPLCEAVTGLSGLTGLNDPVRNGQAYLERLEKDNLFIVRLDEQRQWYRYHHLFQQFLRNQLERRCSRDEIAELHRRAGEWLAQNNWVEEALQHSIAAGDYSRAVQLVAQRRHAFLNGEQWHRLRRWISVFPRDVVEAQPELLLTEAWIARSDARFPEIPAKLDRVEALIAGMSSELAEATAAGTAVVSLQGELDCLRAYQYSWTSDYPRVVFHGQRALETTPSEWWGARLVTRLFLAGAFKTMGDEQRAYAAIYDGMTEDTNQGSHFRARLLVFASLVHLMYADLDGTIKTASQALVLSEKLDQPETLYWAHFLIGVVHYYRNELSAAEGHLTTTWSQRYLENANCAVQSAFALALTYQAQGRTDKAREMSDLAETFAMEISHPILLSGARTFQAELAVRQGRVADAKRWLEQFQPDPMAPTVLFSGASMTPAKVLLATNTAEGRQAAAEQLAQLCDFAESMHDPRDLIELLSLQSLLHDAQDEQAAALTTLERAVTLAEPSGILRTFVDLGPRLGDLLNRLYRRGVAPGYVAEILAAIAQSKPVAATIRQAGLIEPLTERELEVLWLLEQRLSAKEIAERLIIAAGTVKRHTHSIYEKLHVSSRSEAVAKAESLGIAQRPPSGIPRPASRPASPAWP